MRGTLLIALIFIGQMLAFGQVALVEAFPNLTFLNPVDFRVPNDNGTEAYVVSQQGYIYVVPNKSSATEHSVFLDIRDRVRFGDQEGLYNMAFHPNFSQNGYFYVYYSAPYPRRTVLARYSVDPNNRKRALKNSEHIILEIRQPYPGNNGGQIVFGPDGYLYIGSGDGGSVGDPQNNAQDLTNLLGKILRINVDVPSGSKQYSIPVINPYYRNNKGYREEIFAYGFRNPWRFCFDVPTGRIWCADIGDMKFEEINLIFKGNNYGWNITEGSECYDGPQCDKTGITMPIFEYPHAPEWGYSIVSGFVYRGKNVPKMYGKFVYGDYVSGNIWGLIHYGRNRNKNEMLVKNSGLSITGFGLDREGELYVLDYAGKVYTFVSKKQRIVYTRDTKDADKHVEHTVDTTQIETLDSASVQLTSPKNLSADAKPYGAVELTWDDIPGGENGFYIERKSYDENDFSLLDSTDMDESTYTDYSVEDSVTYHYRVAAFTSDFTTGYSDAVSVKTFFVDRSIALDYELKDFAVLVKWKTDYFKPVKGYEIWRLRDGEWKMISYVEITDSMGVSGNYEYLDKFDKNFSGTVYYKLNRLEEDGDQEFTEPLSVKVNFVRSGAGIGLVLLIFIVVAALLSLIAFTGKQKKPSVAKSGSDNETKPSKPDKKK